MVSKMVYHAVKRKDIFQFSCVALSPQTRDQKLESNYWDWRCRQKHGKDVSFEKYMENFEKITITIRKEDEL